jgi:hypothetical protein
VALGSTLQEIGERENNQQPRLHLYRHAASLTSYLFAPRRSVVYPLCLMSEKIQEFLEIPQEFIRDGNQVRHLALAYSTAPPSYTYSFSCGAQNPLKKVIPPSFSSSPSPPLMCFFLSYRILSDFQGCCDRFCCHGFHRLLSQAHSHPHVSIRDFHASACI